MSDTRSDQRAYWDDLASLDPDAAIIDPNDRRGDKNAYLAGIRDHAFRESLARHGIDAGILLDVGCGTGSAARPLLLAGHRLVGIDISPNLLRHAHARCRGLDCVFVVTDGLHLPLYDASFDAAIIYVVLSYLIDDEAARLLLSAIRASLKPGAPLVMIEQVRATRRVLEGGRKVQRTQAGWEHLLAGAGFELESTTVLRHGHFPTTPLVRAGLVPRSCWTHLRLLEAAVAARSGIFPWDYAEVRFEARA